MKGGRILILLILWVCLTGAAHGAGNIVWKQQIVTVYGPTGVSSSPAVGGDGRVYVAVPSALQGLNPDTGEMIWQGSLLGHGTCTPAVSLGQEVVATTIGSVAAFDGLYKPPASYKLKPGRQLWQNTDAVNGSEHSPAIAADGSLYVYSKTGAVAELIAISPIGTTRWRFSTDCTLPIAGYSGLKKFVDPVVAPDGAILFGVSECNDGDSKIWALRQDGSIKWEKAYQGFFTSQIGFGTDGTFYIGKYYTYPMTTPSGQQGYAVETGLYAYDASGEQTWRYSTFPDAVDSSPAVGHGGNVYFGCDDGRLHAVDRNGNGLWTYETGASVRSSPAVGRDGTLYVGSDDKKLYAITAGGQMLWSVTTGGEIQSSPAIGYDGRLYVGSSDHFLYVIQTESGGPADSSWPMFRGNMSRTGSAERLSVTTGLAVQVPCGRLGTQTYGYTLEYYVNPTDQNRVYFTLPVGSVASGTGQSCVLIDSGSLEMSVPNFYFDGVLVGAELSYAGTLPQGTSLLFRAESIYLR